MYQTFHFPLFTVIIISLLRFKYVCPYILITISSILFLLSIYCIRFPRNLKLKTNQNVFKSSYRKQFGVRSRLVLDFADPSRLQIQHQTIRAPFLAKRFRSQSGKSAEMKTMAEVGEFFSWSSFTLQVFAYSSTNSSRDWLVFWHWCESSAESPEIELPKSDRRPNRLLLLTATRSFRSTEVRTIWNAKFYSITVWVTNYTIMSNWWFADKLLQTHIDDNYFVFIFLLFKFIVCDVCRDKWWQLQK